MEINLKKMMIESFQMRYVLMATLVLLISALMTSGQQSATIYYNGTVVVQLNNVTSFHLIGNNVSNLKVIGSRFNLTGDYLYFHNGTKVTISYDTYFPNGVINANEPYNLTFYVLIPSYYSLVYVSPTPVSLETKGSTYNLTVKGNSLDVLFSTAKPTSGGGLSQEDLTVITILIVTDSILAFVIFEYLRMRRSKSKGDIENVREDREEAELATQELNDRDLLVLEAFKKGSKTLADAVRVTGLPKSTVYRRIKKLVKLGYLIERREGGKLWYEVGKLPDKDQNT